MGLKTNIAGNKTGKQIYKNIFFITFIASLAYLAFFVYLLNLGKSEGMFAFTFIPFLIIFFILSLIMAGIAISSLLKYKLNKKNIILKDIPAKVAIGIILILLIFIWRLFVLTLSKDILMTLQLSTTEWIIVGIGTALVIFGTSKKSK